MRKEKYDVVTLREGKANTLKRKEVTSTKASSKEKTSQMAQ